MGDVSDILSLLAIYKPCIVVDEDGGELPLSFPLGDHGSFSSVGGIVRGEGALSTQAATMDSPLIEAGNGHGTPFFVTSQLCLFIYAEVQTTTLLQAHMQVR